MVSRKTREKQTTRISSLSCMSISDKQRVVAGWQALLGRVDWHYAVTLTNRDSVSIRILQKRLGAFIQIVGRSACGRRWYRQTPTCLYWATAVELNALGVGHGHVLLAFCAESEGRQALNTATHYWKWRMGFVDVSRVQSSAEAVSYITKTAAHDGLIELSSSFPRS
jgi:hypothetical protein